MAESLGSNGLPNGNQVRQVRIGMLVNGQQMPGLALKEFTVNNDDYFTADTWQATVALNGLPAGYGAPFWALQPNVTVQFLASLSAGGSLTPVTGGMVDKVDISLDNQAMTISGRDFTAPLIDNISNDKFTNQTSSQVATTLATRRGLIPQVTATTTQVGRFFNAESGYHAEDISEWRLLSFLAQQEGFDLYAKGKTLVFAPPVQDTSPIVVTYSYATQGAAFVRANESTVRLKQQKTLAGDVTVQVRSWQHQTKKAILATWVSQKHANSSTATVSRSSEQSGVNSNGPFYIIRRSGLTQAQADQLAQKTLADICSHEREVNFSGPAIINIDARRTFTLTGTGTAFDQSYPIKSIERTFSWEQGAEMSLTAKSGSPQEAIKL